MQQLAGSGVGVQAENLKVLTKYVGKNNRLLKIEQPHFRERQ